MSLATHGSRLRSPGERPLRVLHAPGMIGGHPQGLAEAERALGLDSWAVSLYAPPMNYAADEVLFGPADGQLRRELKRWRFLLRAWRSFDVFHFNFGTTIMPRGFRSRAQTRRVQDRLAQWYVRAVELLDLRWLRRAGKGIVVTFQGDDARQGDYCRRHFDIHFADEVEADYYAPELDERKRQWIAQFDRYADRIYALCPDLLNVLPKRAEYLPFGNVDPAAWPATPPSADPSRRPMLIHAPSHRGVKGTRFIVAAVEQLRREGVPFDFTLVENLPHHEARRVYLQADLLVDQLLAGNYGGLAVEAMALAKPVVCYLRPGDMQFVPPAMRASLPLIEATPATITDVLRTWLTTRRHELHARGLQSRAFMETWHHPACVAGRLRDAYYEIWAERQRAAA